ncbi:hypothetical protein PRIPAC_92933 [Pristionchus pacificus]|uniref:Uncharacterized protein n=1 Tax=Pristionchus pacificus TaxID=54126 RepID=A0A2A6BJ39_PRIPA|nr:hypothetical protein PRIPAC_92933 [Pristionchus pacificus]|eukprot:PDM65912.1 hypothetical protein PRIPAC_44191 [Pristionchus pacificus]
MRILFILSLLLIVISFVHASIINRSDVKRSVNGVNKKEAEEKPLTRFRRGHEKRQKRAYPHH